MVVILDEVFTVMMILLVDFAASFKFLDFEYHFIVFPALLQMSSQVGQIRSRISKGHQSVTMRAGNKVLDHSPIKVDSIEFSSRR